MIHMCNHNLIGPSAARLSAGVNLAAILGGMTAALAGELRRELSSGADTNFDRGWAVNFLRSVLLKGAASSGVALCSDTIMRSCRTRNDEKRNI